MGPKPSLPPCGYIVVYMGLASKALSALHDEARSRNYMPVFQEVGGDSDDQFREQSRVIRRSGAVGELKRALKAIAACLDPGWPPSVFSFMRSRPGGAEQETPRLPFQLNSKGRVPASIVCALEEGTQLRVFDGCFATKDDAKARVLSIPVGFCVIFRGDLIHNGMPYETTNHRNHCYLSYRGLAWELDIVSSATTNVSTATLN
ncbi:hypothetical protein PHMEG_00041021 [Phytophthora megakarya]|uniref:Uncharacterized protein n=1 Tax=Phytophthora megakarya TaxID=4795 RepID=A0A225UCS7_9STRA|nr:hypothetical protein PHMEG_00041021 [Phytophthora megakarya]